MNEYEKLNALMDEFKTPEDINEVVKTLSTAELKRYIYILGSVKSNG
jgi:division protein CdvB (Snf7/Vps24/ESCRT-III family)